MIESTHNYVSKELSRYIWDSYFPCHIRRYTNFLRDFVEKCKEL